MYLELDYLNRQVNHQRVMRYLITKKSSTKYERIVYEVLKELHVPFKHRWIIEGREVDFLVNNKFCLEINGHEQDEEKNKILANLGYIPIHLHNNEVNKQTVINLIKQLC